MNSRNAENTKRGPMTDISFPTCQQFDGRILVIGDQRPDLLRTAHALESLAATSIACRDEARALLLRFDVDVVVIDAETGTPGVAEVATLRPTATRILLTSGTPPPDAREDPELAILPVPADPHAVLALCRLGLRCALGARTARDLAYRNRRRQGLCGAQR